MNIGKWIRIGAGLTALLLVLLLVALAIIARNQAQDLIYHFPANRAPIDRTPADLGLDYENVQVTSLDGNNLHGWYLPSANGAVIMMQHGYKSDRTEYLDEAEMLARHGYGVLFTTVRAHDINEGSIIAFGLREMPDLEAWYQFLLGRDDVDAGRIGMLGNSLGGSLAIQYSAMNENIQAVVVHSAFSSMADTIATSVSYYTDLPSFPFVPLIQFWGEEILGASMEDINALAWIDDISPRPVLILHNETDTVISPESGMLLYQAALPPKELWLESGLGHADFDQRLPQAFEARVVGFFDRYLLE